MARLCDQDSTNFDENLIFWGAFNVKSKKKNLEMV